MNELTIYREACAAAGHGINRLRRPDGVLADAPIIYAAGRLLDKGCRLAGCELVLTDVEVRRVYEVDAQLVVLWVIISMPTRKSGGEKRNLWDGAFHRLG